MARATERRAADRIATPGQLAEYLQLYLDGNDALAPRTRVNFKLGYGYATQTDHFAANGLAGAPAGAAVR